MNKKIYTDVLGPLRDEVRKKRPKNGEPTVGFSFTTILQHTGRFWLRISEHRTMWQHWNFPHTLLTCFGMVFTFSFNWNRNWKDGALWCDERAEKASRKWLAEMFPTLSQSLWEAYIWTRELFWGKYSLNDCNVMYFFRNKVILGTFWCYHVLPSSSWSN